jgi:tRNA modification GTPase
LFDLIARLEASVDFPEEGYHFGDPVATSREVVRLVERIDALLAQARRGRLIREGLQVVILGPPNAGKSSLFNRLVGASRAIVTDVPGTTRDLLSEAVDIDGIRVTLVDTAGIRDSTDTIEKEGVSRANQAAVSADLVLHVLDRSRPLPGPLPDAIGHQPNVERLLVANKCDLPAAWTDQEALEVSATSGVGIEALRARIAGASESEPRRDEPSITNIRHTELLSAARSALLRANQALTNGEPLSEEFVLADLQQARAALEEVTGRRTTEDVLAHIFERFCIGK